MEDFSVGSKMESHLSNLAKANSNLFKDLYVWSVVWLWEWIWIQVQCSCAPNYFKKAATAQDGISIVVTMQWIQAPHTFPIHLTWYFHPVYNKYRISHYHGSKFSQSTGLQMYWKDSNLQSHNSTKIWVIFLFIVTKMVQ